MFLYMYQRGYGETAPSSADRIGQSPQKMAWQYLKRLNIRCLHHLVIPLLGTYLKELKCPHDNLNLWMFIEVSVVIAETTQMSTR